MANRRCVRKQHRQSVNADAFIRHRRLAVFEGFDVVGVVGHSFFVACVFGSTFHVDVDEGGRFQR